MSEGAAITDLRRPAIGRKFLHTALSEHSQQAQTRCRLGFVLFILVNAVLFIRPGEIVPAVSNWPIYEILIVACLIASLPKVIDQLYWRSLSRNPMSLCVLGLLPAIVLSQLAQRNLYDARMDAMEFSKIVIYYLLLVGLVDSPARLSAFLVIISSFVLCTASLSLLNHHGIIDVPALADLTREYEPGEASGDDSIVRLRAMGIFHDPNDLCLILNAATFICLHWLIRQKGRILKLAWAAPIAVFVYALTLTQSRGGFLSLLVGVVVLLFVRIRWRRAVLLCALLVPAMLIAFSGRLTNMNLEDTEDTAQGRIQLWRDSLVEFHNAPFFGVGKGNLADAIGLVAHDSYLHSYAELGFFGGTLFVGAFSLGVLGLGGLRPSKAPELPVALRELRRCLVPMLAAYMTGIYSLSRCYGNSTYLILGIVGAFLSLCVRAGAELPRVGFRVVRQLVLISVFAVLWFEVFVRAFCK